MAALDILDDTRLERLLQDINHDERATMVAGEIRSKLQCIMTDFDFVVDAWPHYKALVIRRPIHIRERFSRGAMVYAKDPEALRELLLRDGVTEWLDEVSFRGCDSRVMPVFSALSEHHNTKLTCTLNGVLLRVTEDSLTLRPIPDGFTVTSLKPDQSEMANSNWKFSSEYSINYIRDIIGKMPSCCLYDNTGDVVGYAFTYHYGFLGMLHVKEDYRGKGYAKVIVSHLAQKCLQEQKYVSVVVESDNHLSLKLHTDLGFVEVPDLRLSWVDLTPTSNIPTAEKEVFNS
ncbi:glycine N-phenylacetyltransferase-like [Haliotis rubra]|uniref:glycine N-phenylacetyltransferase-like n=1 Tax=Haliotis rubra TaxID=36100 RepID=UPI001EE57719|nr:glycine N-phenylacetyltransferase-like [Haliotis rubra]